jgi:protein dithiol:quinone oxidoreductase
MTFPLRFSRGVLMSIAMFSLAAVALALLAQHQFNMPPCPWCILQRMIYLVIAAVALVFAFIPRLNWQRLGGLIIMALCGAGIASAIYQHQVAAKNVSCNLTLADKILTYSGIESWWPAVFQVTANCAEAAVSIAGIPFEFWSLGLYALLFLLAGSLWVRRCGQAGK